MADLSETMSSIVAKLVAEKSHPVDFDLADPLGADVHDARDLPQAARIVLDAIEEVQHRLLPRRESCDGEAERRAQPFVTESVTGSEHRRALVARCVYTDLDDLRTSLVHRLNLFALRTQTLHRGAVGAGAASPFLLSVGGHVDCRRQDEVLLRHLFHDPPTRVGEKPIVRHACPFEFVDGAEQAEIARGDVVPHSLRIPGAPMRLPYDKAEMRFDDSVPRTHVARRLPCSDQIPFLVWIDDDARFCDIRVVGRRRTYIGFHCQ